MKNNIIFLMAVSIFLLTTIQLCNASDQTAPKELTSLLNAGEMLYDYKIADLNGDGRTDYVFVVCRRKANSDNDCIDDENPVLRIAIRMSNRKLNVVKSNSKIMLERLAGGALGNPYNGMEAGNKWFSVSHAGGGNDRWFTNYLFKYSRKDKTWQLVRAVEGHKALDEEPVEEAYTPPKDYGKIDIADFDPENYKGFGY